MGGLRITGAGVVRQKMTMVGVRAHQLIDQWLEIAGQVIEKEARLNAPIDTGDLEKAIVHDKTSPKTMSVYVDPDKLDLESRDGYDYSIKMHEDTDYKLGPLSQRKADLMPDRMVGAKYLERAIKDNEKELRAEAAKILKELARL